MTWSWKASRLRRRVIRPTASVESVVHRLEGHLAAAPGGALALVEIGSAEPAAVAIAALAYRLASEGRGVVLADAAKGRPLAGILRARGHGVFKTVTLKGQTLSLYVAPTDPNRMAEESVDGDVDVDVSSTDVVSREAGVILVLATVDPAIGADHLAPWAGSAVVMTRAGASTRSRIETVATHLRHARIRILSGILVETDPGDHSSGLPADPDPPAEPMEGLLKILKASGQ